MILTAKTGFVTHFFDLHSVFFAFCAERNGERDGVTKGTVIPNADFQVAHPVFTRPVTSHGLYGIVAKKSEGEMVYAYR